MASSPPLNWEPSTGPFEVRYRLKGNIPWNSYEGNPVASSPVILTSTNIIEGLTYEWQVRKDCGGGEFSNWVQGPDFTVRTACKTPIMLRVQEVQKDSVQGSRVILRWNRIPVPGGVIGQDNPDIKIFYKKLDSNTWVEWTTPPLPKWYDGLWTSPWTLDVGTFQWKIEVQCASGDRPSIVSTETFTFSASACPGLPPNAITYNAALNQFEWAPIAGVTSYQYQILEREPINNSSYNLLFESTSTDPNTGGWNTTPVNIDYEDFVITNMGFGCVDPININNPPGGNTAIKAEYKPGGVLTSVPKGITLSLLGYNSVTQALYKESYEIEAGGSQSTFIFCINWDDRVFVPDFAFKIRVQPATSGLVPGNSYKVRVRSTCEYNQSQWAEFELSIPPTTAQLINLHASIPPQDFEAEKRIVRFRNMVYVSFRIDRPANPPTNESTWTDVKLGNYPAGSEFIPTTEYIVYPPNGGYIKVKTDGDIIATINFLGQGYDSLYYSFSYNIP